jgi:hypothetical protein
MHVISKFATCVSGYVSNVMKKYRICFMLVILGFGSNHSIQKRC